MMLLVLVGARAVSGQGHTLPESYAQRLVAAAVEQTRASVTYDGSYRRIAYPGGDVPADIGVCADVIIRAYRRVGVDLQVKVHEDMRRALRGVSEDLGLEAARHEHRSSAGAEPSHLSPERAGAERAVSSSAPDYQPGDVVTWTVPRNLPHIGIVSSEVAPSGRPMMVHNIGRGPELEDMLFQFPITGHYRYKAP